MSSDNQHLPNELGSTVRGSYHHGDLRAALLDAVERQIASKGLERFSVADAAREAGVSSAAPYRHFRDRADLLGHVAARGFEQLAERIGAARDEHPPGSIESIVALGNAYVQFVASRPELFHLMWGTARAHFEHDIADTCARSAYQVFVDTLEALRVKQRLQHITTYELGTPLWSMVHGLASLLLGDSEFVDRDPQRLHDLVDKATRAYLAGLHLGHGSHSA